MKTITPRENAILSYSLQCPHWFPDLSEVGLYLPPEIRERAPGDGSFEQLMGGTGLDWFGVPWVYQPQNESAMVDHRVPPLLEDICDWREQIRFPDLDAIDWAGMAKRDAAQFTDKNLHRVSLTMGPFERLHSLMGMEEALCALITDPEECLAFFEAVVDLKIGIIEHMLPHFPLDCVECHDDWGHQRNSFFSPEMFRALLVPPMKRLVDYCAQKGLLYEHHSCGYIENLLPIIVDEIGIHVWSSCQAINDVPAIARRFGGRLVMTGGFDCAELDAMTDEEARAFLSARIDDVCRGGVVIPYMARRMRQRGMFQQLLAERADFYDHPENRRLPE